MIDPKFTGFPAVIIGTGPSLSGQLETLRRLRSENRVRLFGPNNTFQDLPLDVWLACDPQWHQHFGKVEGPFDKWHWDKAICERFGYEYIQGVWMVGGKAYPRDEYITPPGPAGGLWLQDRTRISLNHASSAQALNLACHYGCEPLLLVGHDFHYGEKRHYFDSLSDDAGEYPEALRKWSPFEKSNGQDDLMAVYKRIADQEGRPEILNCTPGSKLKWFPMADLNQFG